MTYELPPQLPGTDRLHRERCISYDAGWNHADIWPTAIGWAFKCRSADSRRVTIGIRPTLDAAEGFCRTYLWGRHF